MKRVTRTPTAARGHGKHDHQGVPQGLVLTGQNHVHQHQGQHDGNRQFAEGFLLFFEIARHHEVIPHGAGDPVQPILYLTGHGTQVPPGHIGLHREQTLLILSIDQERPPARFGHHQVAEGPPVRRNRWPG